jgi:hypothetical protein
MVDFSWCKFLALRQSSSRKRFLNKFKEYLTDIYFKKLDNSKK